MLKLGDKSEVMSLFSHDNKLRVPAGAPANPFHFAYCSIHGFSQALNENMSISRHSWSGFTPLKVKVFQGHLNTCKYDAIPCTNQCAAMIPRLLMKDHLSYTCPKRRISCEFCNREFTGETLEGHVGSCQYEPVYCENKCGLKLQRRFATSHRLNECMKKLVTCRYCEKEFLYDTLQGPRFSLDEHLEESTRFHLILMCNLVSRQQRQISTLQNALENLTLNTSGTLIWKITDYIQNMTEAKSKKDHELCSAPFYTSQYGYKLVATLFLNGNGAGEGSHLSVYIRIVPGEYDSLLSWPFSHTVSFTLYDQTSSSENARNIVESFVPDPSWKNFQRPTKEPDSLGFGFPRFVSHEILKKNSYIKDDTIFIKVRVDSNKTIAV
ncbi:TNF receptor-associated factor 4-like isoform X5 [Tachypleus tridentatus]|uniref:TNF receptor-associated factor 4-like isoform X5 n=1 Tax=Tachypleus tridentatus TaxID=6853 RepID=UPI003FD4DFD1